MSIKSSSYENSLFGLTLSREKPSVKPPPPERVILIDCQQQPSQIACKTGERGLIFSVFLYCGPTAALPKSFGRDGRDDHKNSFSNGAKIYCSLPWSNKFQTPILLQIHILLNGVFNWFNLGFCWARPATGRCGLLKWGHGRGALFSFIFQIAVKVLALIYKWPHKPSRSAPAKGPLALPSETPGNVTGLKIVTAEMLIPILYTR